MLYLTQLGQMMVRRYFIVTNTGNKGEWAPFYNVYSIKGKKESYQLRKRLVFDMVRFACNGFAIPIALADGMEIYNDDIIGCMSRWYLFN